MDFHNSCGSCQYAHLSWYAWITLAWTSWCSQVCQSMHNTNHCQLYQVMLDFDSLSEMLFLTIRDLYTVFIACKLCNIWQYNTSLGLSICRNPNTYNKIYKTFLSYSIWTVLDTRYEARGLPWLNLIKLQRYLKKRDLAKIQSVSIIDLLSNECNQFAWPECPLTVQQNRHKYNDKTANCQHNVIIYSICRTLLWFIPLIHININAINCNLNN